MLWECISKRWKLAWYYRDEKLNFWHVWVNNKELIVLFSFKIFFTKLTAGSGTFECLCQDLGRNNNKNEQLKLDCYAE